MLFNWECIRGETWEVLITAYCQFLITNVSKDETGLDIIDIDCVGYVLDDDNPKKWPKENENIIK